MARSAAVLPVELLHALVLPAHPPCLVSVATLTAGSTLLAVRVVEPVTVRVLRTWLHAPARAGQDRLSAADTLRRVRATVPDRPGVLERLAHGFAERDLNVLGVHLHTLGGEGLDEFVLAAPRDVDAVAVAVARAGGRPVQVRRTAATALADGQTRALTLAGRVHRSPAELPSALGELLVARAAVFRDWRPCGRRRDAGGAAPGRRRGAAAPSRRAVHAGRAGAGGAAGRSRRRPGDLRGVARHPRPHRRRLPADRTLMDQRRPAS